MHPAKPDFLAVDPIALKRQKAEELGATHSAASAEEAQQLVWEQLSPGVGADIAIVTVGVVEENVVRSGFEMIRKGGRLIVTGVGNANAETIHVKGTELTLSQKGIQGMLFGGCNPIYDIRKLLGLYRTGEVKLDELRSQTYSLDQINEGYQDMLDGKNIRGVILHQT